MKDTHTSLIGRPTIFSATVMSVICGRVAEGESMRAICRDHDMPARGTVYRWLSENPEFHDRYARAQELRVEVMADEMLEISDDGTTDYVTKVGRNGHEYEAVDQEHIQRSRLRVDTRKFLMSKLMPSKYGERVAFDHTGQITVQHELSDRERMRRMALFLLEDQAAGTIIEHDTGAMNGAGELSIPATYAEMDD